MSRWPASGQALARAALAGNPSDGYGGAVLAITLPSFSARAQARSAPAPAVDPPSALVQATIRCFARELAPSALFTAVQWTTTIPRGVGLGGSSAIVIATTRALCEHCGVPVERDRLAEFALAVETDLGIAAGLQDRVAQAYEGLTFMDFGEQPGYERLPESLVPPLLIAWRTDAGQDSGPVHTGLRGRFEHGDRVIEAALHALATAARDARAAILASDYEWLGRCLDASFDARARMITLDPRHVEMIGVARGAGAAANYTGSGGAIVALSRDRQQRRAVSAALRSSGCEVIAIERAGASQYP